MSGRRSHLRFAVATPWDGAVRVLRDVVVQRVAAQELLAISQVAGLVGEEMSLEVIGGGASLGLRVKVLESAPMIFNGTVRHRLRLEMLSAAAERGELASSTIAERAAPERAELPGSTIAERAAAERAELPSSAIAERAGAEM